MQISVSHVAVDPNKPYKYKDFSPKEVTTLETLVPVITTSVWSPILWEDGKRKELRFISAACAVLDFDDPEMSLAEAVSTFCDVNHIIGTTKNHQREKNGVVCDRFRVVLPWEELCTDLYNYRFNMRDFYSRYPCDKCIDGARYFFPCTEIVSLVSDAENTELKPGRDRIYAQELSPAFGEAGVLPNIARHALQVMVKPGERNTYFYGVTKDMVKSGFGREEILKVMKNSRTYKGCWTPDLERELTGTVESAIKRVRAELGHG